MISPEKTADAAARAWWDRFGSGFEPPTFLKPLEPEFALAKEK